MLMPADSQLSFEKSRAGRRGASLPAGRLCSRSAVRALPPGFLRATPCAFPELTEGEVVRHFVNLSRKNFSVDTHFYPLGSCTMKYNPKVNEWAAALDGFSNAHPLQPEGLSQGILGIFYKLETYLKEITGMNRFTLQPAAGAHGELTGMMLVRAYHTGRGDTRRHKVLVPDSSHGTNPASAALLGYEVVTIKSNSKGLVELKELDKALDNETACLMLTNPNTLGLFEKDILEITRRVHDKGALLYYDGANLNALLGIARPGDMGFDIMHLNLHKTFSTPHGGGGPGAGPVGVCKKLADYLPVPLVEKRGADYALVHSLPRSIGRVKAFYGNTAILVRAFVYIRSLGLEGLNKASEDAILNANYLKEKLKSVFPPASEKACMHEFVLSGGWAKDFGIHASDIGKRILDYGFHAPTVHFPLVVEDALMIEPTETENKEQMDRFAQALTEIAREIRTQPELVKQAPHTMPVGRPDEVLAARQPILSYRDLARQRQALSGQPA